MFQIPQYLKWLAMFCSNINGARSSKSQTSGLVVTGSVNSLMGKNTDNIDNLFILVTYKAKMPNNYWLQILKLKVFCFHLVYIRTVQLTIFKLISQFYKTQLSNYKVAISASFFKYFHILNKQGCKKKSSQGFRWNLTAIGLFSSTIHLSWGFPLMVK